MHDWVLASVQIYTFVCVCKFFVGEVHVAVFSSVQGECKFFSWEVGLWFDYVGGSVVCCVYG